MLCKILLWLNASSCNVTITVHGLLRHFCVILLSVYIEKSEIIGICEIIGHKHVMNRAQNISFIALLSLIECYAYLKFINVC